MNRPRQKAPRVPAAREATREVAARKLAQRLCRSGRSRIGLIPAGEGVDVEAVALHLAPLVAELSDGPVAVVLERDPGDVEGVDVLVPPQGRRANKAIMLRGRGLYAHQLVALSELPLSFEALDGVVVVARAGGASECELEERVALIDEGRQLGVMLLEAR